MDTEKKTRILIVDDEELICWSLKRTLEREEEYTVSCVYTGEDALRQILEHRYDVVITDLRLPDISGKILLEKIGALIKDIPVIVISAYFTDPVIGDMSKCSIFRCVNKPFELGDIRKGVRDAVEYKVKGFVEAGQY